MSAELVTIPFHGTELLAVNADGKPEIVLRPAVESLGLAFDSQRRKLNSRSWACVTQRVLQLGGQNREVLTVDVRTFLMLLATINENNVAEDKRPLLIAYQSEVADVIESYFRDGGAINPRATEDQLSAIANRALLQAEVIRALKGVVSDAHLEAKARIVLARALGEAPELDTATTPLYVWGYLSEKGLPRDLVRAKASGFGKLLKALYTVRNDREPDVCHQELPDGKVRPALAYTEADRRLFDEVWAKHYANVVAPSARGLFDGGDS